MGASGWWARLPADRRGAVAIEYALVASLVAIGCLAALVVLGAAVDALWQRSAQSVVEAMEGASTPRAPGRPAAADPASAADPAVGPAPAPPSGSGPSLGHWPAPAPAILPAVPAVPAPGKEAMPKDVPAPVPVPERGAADRIDLQPMPFVSHRAPAP